MNTSFYVNYGLTCTIHELAEALEIVILVDNKVILASSCVLWVEVLVQYVLLNPKLLILGAKVQDKNTVKTTTLVPELRVIGNIKFK